MTNMTDKEIIRAEIERRMEKHWDLLPDADSPEEDWSHNELCELGAFKELEHLEDFIDSLLDEPKRDCSLAVDEDLQNQVDLLEQEEALKEEICRYFTKHPVKHLTSWPELKNTALHFAEWGAEHLKPKDCIFGAGPGDGTCRYCCKSDCEFRQ